MTKRALRRGLGNARGAALFAVLLLAAVLFSLRVFAPRSGQIELMIAGNDLRAKSALEAAEAGINHALGLIREPGAGGANGAGGRGRGPGAGGANEAADGFDDELAGGGAMAELGETRTLGGESYRYATFGDL